MTPTIILAIAACGLVIGTAVGAVGIGGVLLVPILTLALGIEVKRAVAAALFAYLPSGIVAVTLYALRGSVAWREARLVALGALPFAWVGAQAASRAPAALLEFLIGLLLLSGGSYALRPPRQTVTDRRLPPALLIGLGGVTSFGSALTGAGGAFILLPLLLLLDTPVLTAIGLGQAIILPIAGVASISNVAAGLVDFRLSAGLAVALSTGIALGTPIAHALPQQKLRRVLGFLVVAAGGAMLLRQAVGLI
jgi:uncharacterized membrane protein YfcA